MTLGALDHLAARGVPGRDVRSVRPRRRRPGDRARRGPRLRGRARRRGAGRRPPGRRRRRAAGRHRPVRPDPRRLGPQRAGARGAGSASSSGRWPPSIRPARSIVVEPALRETARDLHEVRDQVLGRGLGHVFAPCTRRAAPCPMLADPRDWCHEERPLDLPPRALALAINTGLRDGAMKFAYLVVRRGDERRWSTAAAPAASSARRRRARARSSCGRAATTAGPSCDSCAATGPRAIAGSSGRGAATSWSGPPATRSASRTSSSGSPRRAAAPEAGAGA